jgi:hypothetical protein
LHQAGFPIWRTVVLSALVAAAIVASQLVPDPVAAADLPFFQAIATILPILLLALAVEQIGVGLPPVEAARESEKEQLEQERDFERRLRDHERVASRIPPGAETEKVRAVQERLETAYADMRDMLARRGAFVVQQREVTHALALRLQDRFTRAVAYVALGEVVALYALASGDRDVWLAALAAAAVTVVAVDVIGVLLLRFQALTTASRP